MQFDARVLLFAHGFVSPVVHFRPEDDRLNTTKFVAPHPVPFRLHGDRISSCCDRKAWLGPEIPSNSQDHSAPAIHLHATVGDRAARAWFLGESAYCLEIT